MSSTPAEPGLRVGEPPAVPEPEASLDPRVGEPSSAGAAAPTPPASRARLDRIATLAILGVVACVIAYRPLARRRAPHPTREQCAAMLDRYQEEVARAYERVPVSRAASAASPEAAVDVETCTRELTVAEVECALHASYEGELERCLP